MPGAEREKLLDQAFKARVKQHVLEKSLGEDVDLDISEADQKAIIKRYHREHAPREPLASPASALVFCPGVATAYLPPPSHFSKQKVATGSTAESTA